MLISEIKKLKIFRSELTESARIQPQFDFTRRMIATASTTTTFQIPVPAGYDFESLGYNIDYAHPVAGLTEHLFIKFSQEQGNRKWSNDFLPIKSIATPGVRGPLVTAPVARYGFRAFHAYMPQNDKIIIEILNTAAEDLEVNVTFIGNLLQVS